MCRTIKNESIPARRYLGDKSGLDVRGSGVHFERAFVKTVSAISKCSQLHQNGPSLPKTKLFISPIFQISGNVKDHRKPLFLTLEPPSYSNLIEKNDFLFVCESQDLDNLNIWKFDSSKV